MFKKLNLNFDNIDLNNLLGNQQTKYNYTSFFEFDVKDQDYLNSLIYSKIKFNIEPTYINVTKIIPPGTPQHTDFWKTALNIYITVGDDKTYFWKYTSEGYLKKETGNTKFYHDKNMELIGSFTANKGDCYLFDTHTAHSVEVKNQSRYILRFVWVKNTFQEVENSIVIIS
jgi:hypothetical protein